MVDELTIETAESDPTSQLVAMLPKVRSYPVLAGYVLCHRIGAGGGGAIYMGYHPRLRHPVAIKLLNPVLMGQNDAAVKRFDREAILSSKVNSPHLVRVTDAGTLDQPCLHYIIMELVDGENVEERVARRGKPLDVREACTIAMYASRGLADAHALGVLHRDLKPANVMISKTGMVLLTDLGIATSLELGNMQVTMTNEFVGTPQYMSPEQIKGRAVDQRADVYSIGVTLYYMLAGEHPYSGQTPYAVFNRVLHEQLPDISAARSDVPSGVAAIIRRCADKDAGLRIQTARELAEGLEREVQKLGPVPDLADAQAGAGRMTCRVTLSDAELQSIAEETRSLQSSRPGPAPQERRRPWRVVGLLCTLLVIGLVAGVLVVGSGARTPIDQRLIQVAQADRFQEAVVIAQDAFTSNRLPKAAQTAVANDLSRILQDRFPSLSLMMTEEDAPACELLGLLAAEGSMHTLAWIEADLALLADNGAWTQIDEIVHMLVRVGALTEATQSDICARLVQSLSEAAIEAHHLRLAPVAISVMRLFTDRKVPSAEQLMLVVDYMSSPSTETDVVSGVARASETLGLDGIVLGEIAQILGTVACEDAREAESARRSLYGLLDLGETEVIRQTERIFDHLLTKQDWAGLSELMGIWQAFASVDADDLREKGQQALRSFTASVTRDSYGAVDQSGEAIDDFLAGLVDLGVPGASLWLIEVRVTWTDEGKLIIRPGVGGRRKAELPQLIDDAKADRGNDGQNKDRFARACFLAAEAFYWVPSLSSNSQQSRRTRVLSGYFAGVQAGSGECAARLVETRLSQTITDETLREVGFSFPEWSELEVALRRPEKAASRGMVLCGLAMGQRNFADPPGALEDSLELLVQAVEAGYAPAREPLREYAPELNAEQLRRAGLQ